jgi:hypothetical protein
MNGTFDPIDCLVNHLDDFLGILPVQAMKFSRLLFEITAESFTRRFWAALKCDASINSNIPV